ncbi:hypothetical protein AB3X91_08995 [Paraburkholderia sp. BR14263]|uniref:hypothetical protein n=1 Tax=unclassified Paraburkholderia TaxID=2615204 RepID=UPI0034CDE31E
MNLEMKLTLPGDHSRHAGRMCGRPPPVYEFEAQVLVLRRIKWGPNQFYGGAIHVLAIVPEKHRIHLPSLNSKRVTSLKRVSEDQCWLTADIDGRNESNAAKVRPFIASGETEWVLTDRPVGWH